MQIDFTNNNKLKPGLYVLATPIGNLEDITIRGIKTLHAVDYIACEDTRVTNILLAKYNISKKLLIYNDHSAEKTRKKFLDYIQQGKSIALVSDAGTPIISDPGHKLIKFLLENNIYVTSMPGACAVINALVLSGAASDKFIFYGFLPIKTNLREKYLQQINKSPYTTIFYETSRKINNFLQEITLINPDKEIIIIREMTKIYEEVIKEKAKNLLHYTFKGELVVVIPPDKEKDLNDIDKIDNEIINITKKLSTKDGQIILKKLYPEIKKNQLYNLLKN